MLETKKANVLGDIRAEADHAMLGEAFYESPDYRSIVESHDRCIIVGRRGTGKSALYYRLGRYWKNVPKQILISIAPEDYEIIGIRAGLTMFSQRYMLVRSAARLIFRYALMMEVSRWLLSDYKAPSLRHGSPLPGLLKEWRSGSKPFAVRVREILTEKLRGLENPENGVAELADRLEVNVVEKDLKEALEKTHLRFEILVDRLDEAYEPDLVGIGMVGGFIHAVLDVHNALPKTNALVFLRDNIFRSIARLDADYSRTMEGQVLRLHWDEYSLQNLIVNRLRIAFGITYEQTSRVWDECTSRDIKGKDGFKRCLRLTLYRPRDLLLLLNNAFYRAQKEERSIIGNKDIEDAAKEISNSRLADLIKEYDAIFPGLEMCCRAFANGQAALKFHQVVQVLEEVRTSDTLNRSQRQHFAILDSAEDLVRSLYSVGFIGLKNEGTGSYVFCHDGKNPELEFRGESSLLVHPCYWIALNLASSVLNPEEAAEIHDEYDIEVSSETPDLRKRRIGQIMGQLADIPPGHGGSRDFEDWCAKSIRVVFAAGLRNIEQKPNASAVQRRDIVARNSEGTEAWSRILSDYGSRQVVFEVKNYDQLTLEDYRQMNSYLTGDYGNIGFFITRAETENIEQENELEWARFMYAEHKKIIVKLTGKFLHKLLGKARSPQKHDAADHALNGLLDRYVRNYFSIPIHRKKGKR